MAHTCVECACFWVLLIEYGISGLGGGIKYRPGPSELADFGPEFKKVWDSFFVNAPDKPVIWIGILSAYVFQTGSSCSFVP